MSLMVVLFLFLFTFGSLGVAALVARETGMEAIFPPFNDESIIESVVVPLLHALLKCVQSSWK